MDIYKDFDACSNLMIDSIKGLLYDRHSDIFERIDFHDDDIYLEPLLYAYLNQSDVRWLDCIIYAFERNKKKEFKVFTNNAGIFYIPKIGYYRTNIRNNELLYRVNDHREELIFQGATVDFIFEPIVYIEGKIEVLKYEHPLYTPLFINENKGLDYQKLVINDIYKDHVSNFKNGLKALRRRNPKHHQILKRNLKCIMIYSASQPYSFAAMSAHNMIFFNVKRHDNELYFFDHLAHEGAHVTFNTLSYKSKTHFFKYPHHTPFSIASGNPEEHSTLYLRFHGLFTFYEITKSWEQFIFYEKASAIKIHEAKGRFAFQLNRFKQALTSFENLDIFEPEGLKWYEFFKEKYSELYTKYGFMRKDYDFSDQSYDFDPQVFLFKNPLIVNNG